MLLHAQPIEYDLIDVPFIDLSFDWNVLQGRNGYYVRQWFTADCLLSAVIVSKQQWWKILIHFDCVQVKLFNQNLYLRDSSRDVIPPPNT